MAGAAGSPERAAGAGSEPRSAELCDRPSLRQRAAPEARYRAGGHDALLLVARGSQKISRSRVAALRKVAAAREGKESGMGLGISPSPAPRERGGPVRRAGRVRAGSASPLTRLPPGLRSGDRHPLRGAGEGLRVGASGIPQK